MFVSQDTPYVELAVPADEAATQIFIAAGLYFVTFSVSVLFWLRAIWRARDGHELLEHSQRL